MGLPPILYHYFPLPLPHAPTLVLQNLIHATQLRQRAGAETHQDYLLLLQHRPVYTAGRRQSEESISEERKRLTQMGADFEVTERGGQLTYHGPGQIVGYPILDLGRYAPAMPVREYVDRIQRLLQEHLLEEHEIVSAPSDNTGVFLDDGDGRGAKSKVASIGVQVRHRLTTHGFALNVTRSPLAWFDNVVACGLADVKATAIAGRSKKTAEDAVSVEGEVPALVRTFGRVFERDMKRLDLGEDVIGSHLSEVEELARTLQRDSPVPSKPVLPSSLGG